MLSLDSPRWKDLYHARSDASDIPALLRKLNSDLSENQFDDVLTSIMSLVWHQCVYCSGGAAVAPHFADMCVRASLRRRAHLIGCIALIEIARKHYESVGGKDDAPSDIREEFNAVLDSLPKMICDTIAESWDDEVSFRLTGALLVAKGFPNEGWEIMAWKPQEESEISKELWGQETCPSCRGKGWVPWPRPKSKKRK